MSETENSYSDFGRYQKRLCFILFLISVPGGFGTFQFLVTHRQPSFICNNKPSTGQGSGPAVTTPGNEKFTGRADLAGAPGHASMNSSCHSTLPIQVDTDHNLTIGQCVFFGEHKSVVTEYELVCNKAWIKPLLVAIFMVGMMIGGQTGGTLSDKFGRRRILVIAMAWQIVCNLILSFAWSVTSYGVILFLSALPGSTFSQAGSLLGSEFVSPSKRSIPFFCLLVGYSMGYMLLPVTAYFIHDWRWWFRLITLVCLPCFPIVWFLIDEPPMWLMAAGKMERAAAVIRKVNKYNGIKDDGEEVEEILLQSKGQNCDDLKREGVWSTIKSVARVPALLIRLLIIFLAWMMVNMTYYAIALNNDSLSGDWLWNIFFFGLVELASAIGYGLCSKLFGGRNCYVVMMTVTAMSLAATPFASMANGTAGIVLSLVSKFNVTVCFSIIYVYTGELFPTNVRNTVLALSSAVSRLGGVLSPFIIYADEVSDSVAPSIGMAAVILLSALAFLHLPESKDYPLPQTVKDAQAMKSDVCRLCCNAEISDVARWQQSADGNGIVKT